MLVARRGLGIDELRLVSPGFAAAVRWAAFADRYGSDLGEMRAMTTADDAGLTGQALTNFTARRQAARESLKEKLRVLFPEDDDG